MSGDDRGVQAERTSLAWQRTALALGAWAVLFARAQWDTLGHWAWLLGILGIVGAALVGSSGLRRHARDPRRPGHDPLGPFDGLLPTVLASVVFVGGCLSIATLILWH